MPTNMIGGQPPHRTWLITGVSSGFGRAVAEAALAAGDKVVGTVRKEADKRAFEALSPGRAVAMLLDVTDEAAVHATVAAAETLTGGIDVLVNNAGYGLVGGVEEASMAMRARRAGHILTITSVSGLVGWPSLGIYSGSKFALEGICETLAMEVEPLGIRVTIVEPGGFRTEFAKGSRARTARIIDDYDATVGQSRRILASHAGEEIGDPAKAAQAILKVVDAAAPPLRLLLGRDAVGYTTDKLAQQTAEMEAWRAVSEGTDFAGH
jgi:NAD(P)-dependent dehydrogenase (short-subunit alcohol dehydrogenase family)